MSDRATIRGASAHDVEPKHYRCTICKRAVLVYPDGHVEHAKFPPNEKPHVVTIDTVEEIDDPHDVVPLCDFCLLDLRYEDVYCVPGEPFVYEREFAEGFHNTGDSAACETCVQAFLRKDWQALFARNEALKSMDRNIAVLQRRWCVGLWERLHEALRGREPYLERKATITTDGQHR